MRASRPGFVVIGCLLKGMREGEQDRFAEVRRNQLRADRQAVHESGRQRQRRKSREARRNREYVLQVHGDWISRVLADRKGGGGRDRRQDDVHGIEG